MKNLQRHVLLADDDADDCIFFEEILVDMPFKATLTTVNNGSELMHLLHKTNAHLPDLIFLDLNMPRKTGEECLLEIKRNQKLKHIPVIIFSTSLDTRVVSTLYEHGAHYYIRKPGEYPKLKEVIRKAITLTAKQKDKRPGKEKFVLSIE